MPNPREHDTAANSAITVLIYAAEALGYAAAEDWDRAGHRVQAVADAWPEHLRRMVILWCDAYADHACDGRSPGPAQAWTWHHPGSGEIRPMDLTGVPPRLRWAGQLILARTRRDTARFDHLWVTRPGEPGALREYVMTVLETVAATLANTPRGFAVTCGCPWTIPA